MLPVELNFNITIERNKIRDSETPFLFQTYLSSITCRLLLSRYRAPKSGYEVFFESKTEWISKDYYFVW